MKKITWADLFSLLYDKANKLENIGKFDWHEQIGDFDKEKNEIFFYPEQSLKNTL